MPTTKPPTLPEGAHTDFASSFSYRDYLKLDAILSSQRPLTTEHDELLFIIIHQATGLAVAVGCAWGVSVGATVAAGVAVAVGVACT
ncbi:MAG: hypothetical protein IH905_14855 [Proteobacteria bacterium]|nr:hypothetical protein [Pseudomonadota bacterium]